MTLATGAALAVDHSAPATTPGSCAGEPNSAPPEAGAPTNPRAEARRTLRKARKQERKLRRKIKAAEAAGRHAVARWLQKRYLRSFSARLVAVEKGNSR